MSPGARSFGTTNGVVTVRDDAITTRSSPRRFLAGQSVRWRHGSGKEQAKAALMVGAFLVSIVGFVGHLYLIADRGIGWSSLFYGTSVGFIGYSLWRNYGRKTTIPRSAIQSVTLDEDSRQLTVTHRTRDGPLSTFREDVSETRLSLGTDDDVRNVRQTLRLRGIQVEPASAEAGTEVTHRIVSRNGGHYCDRCDALVTPNDKVCPRCEYTLWVETSTPPQSAKGRAPNKPPGRI